jgi:hypothetical protein
VKKLDFPINVSADDILSEFMTCNCDNVQEMVETYQRAINEEDQEGQAEFAETCYRFYMVKKHSNGIYVVCKNATKMLEDSEKRDSLTNEIFEELDIDISHMRGMTAKEMFILIIPMKDIEDAKYIQYVFRKNYNIDVWLNKEIVS